MNHKEPIIKTENLILNPFLLSDGWVEVIPLHYSTIEMYVRKVNYMLEVRYRVSKDLIIWGTGTQG